MSTRSARARGSKKKVSYVETYSDESDVAESGGSEEEEWNSKKKPPKKKKQRLGKQRTSDDDSDSSDSDGADGDSQDDDEDEQETGVDFSQFLPFEIVAEIFSYLNPKELLGFDSLSRSFHAILSGPSSRSLWVKARKNLQIPDVDYRGVTERQLANLLFNRECELCGTGKVETPDLNLCRRFCFECREANWVKLDEVDKLYPDFHAASAQASQTTKYSAKLNRYGGSRGYALYSDLKDASEYLEQLDLLDASGQALSDDDEEDVDDQRDKSKSKSGRRTGRIKHVSDGPSNEEVAKKFRRAKRLKGSYWSARRLMGDHLENEATNELSPRVRMYLKCQKERHQEWEKVVETLHEPLRRAERVLQVERKAYETSSRRLINSRRSLIEKKLRKKGFKRANFADPVWTTNELVNAPRYLTDQEWRKIKKRITKLAGQSTAYQLCRVASSSARAAVKQNEDASKVASAKKKLARLEALATKDRDDEDDEEMEESLDEDATDDDQGDNGRVGNSVDWKEKVLKKPKDIPSKIWKLVLPHLNDLASHDFDLDTLPPRVSRRNRRKNLSSTQNPLAELPFPQLKIKAQYFASKYKKLVDAQTTRAQKAALPLFSCFTHLPTVNELVNDIPLFATRVDDKDELIKIDAIWALKLDDILEEAHQYALDTVVHVVKTVLLATTDASEEEIAELDLVELLGASTRDVKMEEEDRGLVLDDAFFARPSSWVVCDDCKRFFGSYQAVLEHRHEKHNYRLSKPEYGFPNSPEPFPLGLSIEAACALSAIFDVADVAMDSPTAAKDLRRAFAGKMLVWENRPLGQGIRSGDAKGWKALVCQVHRTAIEEDNRGRQLEAPSLVLRNKNRYEERWAREW